MSYKTATINGMNHNCDNYVDSAFTNESHRGYGM